MHYQPASRRNFTRVWLIPHSPVVLWSILRTGHRRLGNTCEQSVTFSNGSGNKRISLAFWLFLVSTGEGGVLLKGTQSHLIDRLTVDKSRYLLGWCLKDRGLRNVSRVQGVRVSFTFLCIKKCFVWLHFFKS